MACPPFCVDVWRQVLGGTALQEMVAFLADEDRFLTTSTKELPVLKRKDVKLSVSVKLQERELPYTPQIFTAVYDRSILTASFSFHKSCLWLEKTIPELAAETKIKALWDIPSRDIRCCCK